MLAPPGKTAQIYGKQKMDECLWRCVHKRRELNFTEANKMDGRIPSHPISLHLPALMFDTSERSAKGEQARHIQQTTRREDGNAGK